MVHIVYYATREENERNQLSSRAAYDTFLPVSIGGTDNGAPIRWRDSGWRSKSLTIGQSVKDLVQCVIVLVY